MTTTTATTTGCHIGQLAKAADISPRDALDATERVGVKLWHLPGCRGPQDWWFTSRLARTANERCDTEDIECDLTEEQARQLCLDLELDAIP